MAQLFNPQAIYLVHIKMLPTVLINTIPDKAVQYESRDKNEILAVVVRWIYTIDEPLTYKRTTENIPFCSFTGCKMCYSRKRVNE